MILGLSQRTRSPWPSWPQSLRPYEMQELVTTIICELWERTKFADYRNTEDFLVAHNLNLKQCNNDDSDGNGVCNDDNDDGDDDDDGGGGSSSDDGSDVDDHKEEQKEED